MTTNSNSCKFKVGDKVRITGNSHNSNSINSIGDVGTITEVDSNGTPSYRVRVGAGGNMCNWATQDDLEYAAYKYKDLNTIDLSKEPTHVDYEDNIRDTHEPYPICDAAVRSMKPLDKFLSTCCPVPNVVKNDAAGNVFFVCKSCCTEVKDTLGTKC